MGKHQVVCKSLCTLPTPEDLIIMKAIAHRPKDFEDIRTIVDKFPDLDHHRIERWVRACYAL